MALDMGVIPTEQIKNYTTPFLQQPFQDFTFYNYLSTIKPLLFFIAGVALYSLFVFKFYKFLARRDIIKLDLKEGEGFGAHIKEIGHILVNALEDMVLTPLAIFFWFIVVATLMLLLSKSHSPQAVILTSISIIAAARITSYYSEDLSQDVSKLIPFAVLGVFLSDISYFSLDKTIEVAKQLPFFWKYMMYYLMFVIALEFVMRLLHTTVTIFRPHKKEKKEKGKD